MANEEQLAILRKGVKVWNRWRATNFVFNPDLRDTFLRGARLDGVNLQHTVLTRANLYQSDLRGADLRGAKLIGANLGGAILNGTNLDGADLMGCNVSRAVIGGTTFGNSNLSETIGLDQLIHSGPSQISRDAYSHSRGKISSSFLRGIGLSDWEIEIVKLYTPGLSNEEINNILYRIYDLRAQQALQLSPLFISYSHVDNSFVDKIETYLDREGIRFWRDVHHSIAGPLEKQIDQAIRQNPTVLLILSANSIKSDWVEHEVHTARELEKATQRHVLCPIALDDSWKDSPWPKRIMEQIMEYNILDFSAWKDDSKFDDMFRKLIDGLELFYKG